MVATALLALAGCAAAPAESSLATGAAGATAGTGGGGPDVSDGGPRDTAAANATAPGRYLTNATTAGSGPCAGVTLTDVLVQIRALDPTLVDIVTIYNPAAGTGDGSYIYPYVRSDGGFDVVLKRGLGDCPAGCTENDYNYFATNDTCRAEHVGHYHAAWGAGSCLNVEGAPMWNHPAAPDPLTVCGQDNAPAALAGSYQLRAVGQRMACATSGATANTGSVDATVTLVVVQDAKDPSMGSVTFSGTGYGLVDGVALPARFQRRRFDAAFKATNLPSSCPRESSVTARFDFEGYQPGGVEVSELGNDACELCKGSMSLSLSVTR